MCCALYRQNAKYRDRDLDPRDGRESGESRCMKHHDVIEKEKRPRISLHHRVLGPDRSSRPCSVAVSTKSCSTSRDRREGCVRSDMTIGLSEWIIGSSGLPGCLEAYVLSDYHNEYTIGSANRMARSNELVRASATKNCEKATWSQLEGFQSMLQIKWPRLSCRSTVCRRDAKWWG